MTFNEISIKKGHTDKSFFKRKMDNYSLYGFRIDTKWTVIERVPALTKLAIMWHSVSYGLPDVDPVMNRLVRF